MGIEEARKTAAATRARALRMGPPENVKAKIQRALKLSQLFDRAARATREAALSAASIDVVGGGAVIVAQGQPTDAIFVIGRGRARIERDAGGGRVVPLGYRGSGD